MGNRVSTGAELALRRRRIKRQQQQVRQSQPAYTPVQQLPADIEEAVQKFFQLTGQSDGTQR